jgi:hypothetical protein
MHCCGKILNSARNDMSNDTGRYSRLVLHGFATENYLIRQNLVWQK